MFRGRFFFLKGEKAMRESHKKTVHLVLLALMTTFAFVSVLLVRIPIVLFLKYEPKDVVILLTSLLLGPIEGLIVSVTTSFLEMITISETGWWGFFMNILSSMAFVLPPALLNLKKTGVGSRLAGVGMGVMCTTAVMLLWNYIVSPLYMGVGRQEIVPLLVTAFLPFNLIKGTINASLTMILFSPIEKALNKARLVPDRERLSHAETALLYGIGVILLVISVACVFVFCR